jgi:hypothetical protein
MESISFMSVPFLQFLALDMSDSLQLPDLH